MKTYKETPYRPPTMDLRIPRMNVRPYEERKKEKSLPIVIKASTKKLLEDMGTMNSTFDDVICSLVN